MRCLVVLVMSLTACGDDAVRRIIDAPPSSIGSLDGALPPPVSVTVTFGGAPQEGLTAYFVNADGSPVATQTTDATGTATQEIAAGGSVTVVVPTPQLAGIARIPSGPTTAFTYESVKPGDQLRLAQPFDPKASAGPTFTLTTAAVAGATGYLVDTVCHGAENESVLAPPDGSTALLPTGTVAMPPGCSTADVVVLATNPSTVATLYHPALTVTQGQTVDLTNEPFVAVATATYAYTNVPSATIVTSFSRFAPAGRLATNQTSGAVANGSASVALAEPVLAGAEAVVTSELPTPNNDHIVVDWGGSGGDYSLDAAAQLLVELTAAPSFDLATETLSWTPAATGVAPDLVSATLAFSGDAIVGVWRVVAPYAGGTLQLPPIAGYLPAATDGVQIDQLETAKVPGGYDAARASALAGVDAFVADGATGRALVDDYLATPPAVVRKRTR
jgi:hypothetical protein